MSEGSYQSMDLGELTSAFEHLGLDTAFRAVGDVPDDVEDYVYLATTGPYEVSTCQTLVPVTQMPIWDVNGYYRAIGISWPYRPTVKQMRLAYVEVDGPNDDYATYAFKRLLDKSFRRRYDRRDIGQPMDDIYRWLAVRRMASKWAKDQSMATGRVVSIDDLLGEDLIERMSKDEIDEANEGLQAQHEASGNDLPEDYEPPEEVFYWPYAYYLWGSRAFDDKRLAAWQEMLVRAFSAKGLSLHMAVGYLGRTRASAARVRHPKPGGGHVQILFLHEDVEPTQELANDVVSTYHNRPQHVPLDQPLYLH